MLEITHICNQWRNKIPGILMATKISHMFGKQSSMTNEYISDSSCCVPWLYQDAITLKWCKIISLQSCDVCSSAKMCENSEKIYWCPFRSPMTQSRWFISSKIIFPRDSCTDCLLCFCSLSYLFSKVLRAYSGWEESRQPLR